MTELEKAAREALEALERMPQWQMQKEAITALRRALEQQPAEEPVAWEQELANILCRIHRDGGHYVAKHGWRKAIDDADLKVAQLNAAFDTTPPAAPVQEPEEWDERCVLGHCGSPTGCELSNRCRADTPPAAPVQEPVARYCCHSCFKASAGVMLDRMILCPECGNKRCPKASDHKLECTGSNEPGQPGSIYTRPQPAAQWVGLTDEYLENLLMDYGYDADDDYMKEMLRDLEARLREKNGGAA